MKIYNTRSPEQWVMLNAAVGNWQGKTVVDLGCGYGDLLVSAALAGATVTGIDNNKDILESIANLFRKYGVGEDRGFLIRSNLNDIGLVPILDNIETDIAICFSALPYLHNPRSVLEWMANHAVMSFVECQYVGDGPGNIEDRMHMKKMLERYWSNVARIGSTLVKGRGTHRDIWMCA